MCQLLPTLAINIGTDRNGRLGSPAYVWMNFKNSIFANIDCILIRHFERTSEIKDRMIRHSKSTEKQKPNSAQSAKQLISPSSLDSPKGCRCGWGKNTDFFFTRLSRCSWWKVVRSHTHSISPQFFKAEDLAGEFDETMILPSCQFSNR